MAKDPTVNDFAHTWKHSYHDRYGNPSYEITVITYQQTTDELVEDFAMYLMGCGFSQGNVLQAFQRYVDEHSGVLKKADTDEQAPLT